VQLLTFGGGVLVCAVLTPRFYVLPLLVDQGGGLGRALVQSARRVRTAWMVPFAATALPWIVGLPFLYVLRRSATLAHQLRPEVVLAVMLLESVVVLVAGLYVVEASARLHVRPRGVGR
jgi:hypothetical protein